MRLAEDGGKSGKRSLRGCLRTPAAARDLLPRHVARAVVTQVSLLRAPPCVGKRNPRRRALSLFHFIAAVVAHQDRFSRHEISLLAVGSPVRLRVGLRTDS